MHYETVLTYGTFDLFHRGHASILQRARKLGDFLIVGCSTDEFNANKGKNSHQNFLIRKAALERLPYVDHVFSEHDWGQKSHDIQKFKVDTFVMGDDWLGKFDWLKNDVAIRYLPRTKGISSTLLRTKLEIQHKYRSY
ncbi:MAG: adenylyltransferase/cytidyltransferase family protein [Kordiimonadaceae bacterium]|nr:adenylyltransferase/cytidyltransferase family protein [Kordiimonadaceae bacterium]